MPHVASSETPLVFHMGKYEEKRHKHDEQRHTEQREYLEKVHACGSCMEHVINEKAIIITD